MKLISPSMLGLTLLLAVSVTACSTPQTPQSASGVQKVTVQVPVDPTTGQTVEQAAIGKRLLLDNKIGSIKHLYVVAPDSGKVLIYSTVKGKVTSSGKRLTPNTVNSSTNGFSVRIGNENHYTSEVLQDDGTYGTSSEYIYWFDTNGVYHQHFFTGGQIIHLSDQPLNVPAAVLNIDQVKN